MKKRERERASCANELIYGYWTRRISSTQQKTGTRRFSLDAHFVVVGSVRAGTSEVNDTSTQHNHRMGKKKGNQHRTFANYSKWPHLLIF